MPLIWQLIWLPDDTLIYNFVLNVNDNIFMSTQSLLVHFRWVMQKLSKVVQRKGITFCPARTMKRLHTTARIRIAMVVAVAIPVSVNAPLSWTNESQRCVVLLSSTHFVYPRNECRGMLIILNKVAIWGKSHHLKCLHYTRVGHDFSFPFHHMQLLWLKWTYIYF